MVIDQQIKLCGYFAIVSSENMSAKDAMELYKGRDVSEKLFRGDKSYLGNKTERNYSLESVESKIFIEFVAIIIRCKIYTKLKEYCVKNNLTDNYMTVPAAIRELEKIEMVRRLDSVYHLSHSLTATQKTILKALNISEIQLNGILEKISKTLEPKSES